MRPLLVGGILLLAVTIVAVVLVVLFIFPGYVESPGSTESPLPPCGASVQPGAPYPCVAMVDPPTAPCTNGSLSEFSIDDVQFSLHSFWECHHPQSGLDGIVNDSGNPVQAFTLFTQYPALRRDGKIGRQWMGAW